MAELIAGPLAPRSVDAGRGLAWWTEAWALFMKNAGLWILLALALLLGCIVVGMIPFLGFFVTSLLAPVFAGSWMLTARKAEAGEPPRLGDLGAAFNDKATPLLVLGALLVGATLLVVLAAGVLGVGAFMGAMAGGSQGSAGGLFAAIGIGMLALLVILVPGLVMAMAFWFAPALVVFRDVAPVAALKASFAANLRNVGAFVVYGVIYLVAAVAASIPFGLGWIVLIPVTLLTVYMSYLDVFGA